MEYNRSTVVFDAVPHDRLRNINENVYKDDEMLITLLDDFTKNDYKSIFFLLIGIPYINVNLDNFFDLTKRDTCYLKQDFLEVCRKINNFNEILIELLGTMKMKKKLRLLGTCYHVFEELENRKFNQINKFWKMLYLLCEELTDENLMNLKQSIPDNFKGEIVSAEDFFCWALLNNIFSDTKLSKLEDIFKDYDKCLNIIKNFQLNKLYEIRTPTEHSNCGIAVIINFEIFDEKSKLTDRSGSDIDVENLKKLWMHFGFKTFVHKNLKYQETLEKLKMYTKFDHSNHDVFVCCILSHGKANSIYTSDGKEIPILDLVAAVTNEGKSLASKPKLFFIQACQGSHLHQGVGKPILKLEETPDGDNKVNSRLPPVASDVLIAVSTITGFVSYRNTITGSWFVNALYETMMQIGDICSIHDVMTEVNNRVNKMKADYGPQGPRYAQQIPICNYSLNKTLILKKRILMKNNL